MPIVSLPPLHRDPNAIATTSGNTGIETRVSAAVPTAIGGPGPIPPFVAAPPPAEMTGEAEAEK